QTFLPRRTASKVLQYFNQQQLLLPRQDRFGDVVWKPPTVSAILSILNNPADAGAFVSGRTQHTRDATVSARSISHNLPMDEWKIRVNDQYPASLSWPTFEKIQARLRDPYAEYDRNQTRGIPRAGPALLPGLLYCGACGHQRMVQYKCNTDYRCNHL